MSSRTVLIDDRTNKSSLDPMNFKNEIRPKHRRALLEKLLISDNGRVCTDQHGSDSLAGLSESSES